MTDGAEFAAPQNLVGMRLNKIDRSLQHLAQIVLIHALHISRIRVSAAVDSVIIAVTIHVIARIRQSAVIEQLLCVQNAALMRKFKRIVNVEGIVDVFVVLENHKML